MLTEPRKTIAIIPARGGSKRIPRKNIRCFNGRPMLEWSVKAPQTSRQFDEIMVRTEDLEFAEIAEPCSAKFPFLAELKLRVTLQQLCRYVIKFWRNIVKPVVVLIWLAASIRQLPSYGPKICQTVALL
jgi:CMP-N-acetylneuraminic acid synthetase